MAMPTTLATSHHSPLFAKTHRIHVIFNKMVMRKAAPDTISNKQLIGYVSAIVAVELVSSH